VERESSSAQLNPLRLRELTFCSSDQPVHAKRNASILPNWELFPKLSLLWKDDQGPFSRKSRKPFEPKKPFVKLQPAHCVKLVFSYLVLGIKIKTTPKFRAWRRLRFEHTKRIISPVMCPKSFRTFGKRAPFAISSSNAFHCGLPDPTSHLLQMVSTFRQLENCYYYYYYYYYYYFGILKLYIYVDTYCFFGASQCLL